MATFKDYILKPGQSGAPLTVASVGASPVISNPWEYCVSGLPQGYTSLQQFRADLLKNGYERVWWYFYDSVKLDAADANTRVLKYFQEPVGVGGKNLIRTNFYGAGQFPSPQFAVIHKVGWYCVPITTADPATTHDDFLLFTNNTTISFEKNQKKYFTVPCWAIPAGGGQISYSQPGSASTRDMLWNGIPDHRGMVDWRIPLIIEQNQHFEFTQEVDADAFNTFTGTAVMWGYVGFWCELFRAIA